MAPRQLIEMLMALPVTMFRHQEITISGNHTTTHFVRSTAASHPCHLRMAPRQLTEMLMALPVTMFRHQGL
jgi:hypothetical protein